MESYWRASAPPLGTPATTLASDEVCDTAVIGAGYTGLMAAYRLATEYQQRVVVLEAEVPGWGASGRNGGFCCVGSSKLSNEVLEKRYGAEDVTRFFDIQVSAVTHVVKFAEQHSIELDAVGNGEIQLAHSRRDAGLLEARRQYLAERFNHHCELLDRPALIERGFCADGVEAGLLDPVGFGLHPLKYLRGIATTVATSGARVYSHSPVVTWDRSNGRHRLTTPAGSVKADRVIVATNGYTPEQTITHLRGRLLPVVSAIVVTRPLTDREISAQGWSSHTPAYDSRQLLHYFRMLPDNRFLFGGRGAVSETKSALDSARARLTRDFRRMFPGWKDVEITHGWHGRICFSAELVPFVGPLDEAQSVWSAFAYHGNGVAMASYCGGLVSDLLAGGKQSGPPAPRFLTRALKAFPLPILRKIYLGSAYLGYRLTDAFH